MQESGKPVRLKILKSRQQGISTIACALLQHGVQTSSGIGVMSIADKKDLPQQWLDRGKQWYEQTPTGLRPYLSRSNRIELYLPGANNAWQSRYTIGSAMGQTPGMGATLQMLHCSELSNWPDPVKTMSDLRPAVPKNVPGTMIIFESTGEMVGDWWHEEIMRTLRGEDDFSLVFLPWFVTAEYHLWGEIDEYTPDELILKDVALKWVVENPHYAKLANFQELSDGQLLWRRDTVRNEFSGDAIMFACRYPASIDEAFLAAGQSVFAQDHIRRHALQATKPVKHLKFEWFGQGYVQGTECDEADPMSWSIWEEPQEFSDYAFGADVAEGKPSNPNDKRSDPDCSTAAILDRRNLKFVATYSGRPDPDVFGEELKKVATFYKYAWGGPEINSAGFATIVPLKDYPHLLVRKGNADEFEDKYLAQLGWRTTNNTRAQLITDWKKFGRESELTICDERVVNEERTFVRSRTGKEEHRVGAHDDLLFAHMIALQAHLLCPRGAGPAKPKNMVLAQQLGYKPKPTYAHVGGYDMEEFKTPVTCQEWR